MTYSRDRVQGRALPLVVEDDLPFLKRIATVFFGMVASAFCGPLAVPVAIIVSALEAAPQDPLFDRRFIVRLLWCGGGVVPLILWLNLKLTVPAVRPYLWLRFPVAILYLTSALASFRAVGLVLERILGLPWPLSR